MFFQTVDMYNSLTFTLYNIIEIFSKDGGENSARVKNDVKIVKIMKIIVPV